MNFGNQTREREYLKFSVKDKLNEEDNKHLVLDEERKYASLKNELIELQLGAEQGLILL